MSGCHLKVLSYSLESYFPYALLRCTCLTFISYQLAKYSSSTVIAAEYYYVKGTIANTTFRWSLNSFHNRFGIDCVKRELELCKALLVGLSFGLALFFPARSCNIYLTCLSGVRTFYYISSCYQLLNYITRVFHCASSVHDMTRTWLPAPFT